MHRLLEQFRITFDGHPYIHRNSSLGDIIACCLFDDLYALDRCEKFKRNVDGGLCAINTKNRRVGHKDRRGDGTFGETVPGQPLIAVEGSAIPRGSISAVEIGCEVKILAKAMIKQIDRVMGDLIKQVGSFKSGNDTPITVGVVGINHAEVCQSFEGDRTFLTDGKKHKHPIQEAAEVERRIVQLVKPAYDELIILRFRATNIEPFGFEWFDESRTTEEYSTLLARVCRAYGKRN